MPPVLFRVDGGTRLGAGHVTRCLALARTLAAAGAPIEFLSQLESKTLHRDLEAASLVYTGLENPHPLPEDIPTTLATLERLGHEHGLRPWLVLDGYQFNRDYVDAMKSSGNLVAVIDDWALLDFYPADLIINQNPGAEELDYQTTPSTLSLLGPRFAMLRPEFANFSKATQKVPETAQKLLATMGSSDPGNDMLRVIEALDHMEFGPSEVTVVAGADNPHWEQLQHRAAEKRIRFMRSTNMPELMAWADFAVSAGGSTALELAFMGVPSLLVPTAPNQMRLAQNLKELNGALAVDMDAPRLEIATELSRLMTDQALRRKLSQTAQGIVDGKGARRIFQVLRALDATQIDRDLVEIRKATAADAKDLWRLANDPETRNQSFGRPIIEWESHFKWVEEKLSSMATSFWIISAGDTLLATCRFERIDTATAEVHYAVAAPFRGKGLGSSTLLWTLQPGCEDLGVRRIIGTVLRQNEPSIRGFLSAGFTRIAEKEERGRPCYVFERACSS